MSATPDGTRNAAGLAETEGRNQLGCQSERVCLLQRPDHERSERRHRVEEDVGVGGGELGDLRVDVGGGGLVPELLDDLDVVGALDRGLEALDVAIAEVVVLEQDRDLVVLGGVGQQLAEGLALLLVDRKEPQLPGALFAVAEERVAGLQEHLRDLLVDRRLPPGAVRRRAEAEGGAEDAVGLHLLEVGERALRVVAVVVAP